MYFKNLLVVLFLISFGNGLEEDCYHKSLGKNGKCINLKDCPRKKQSKNSVFLPQLCEEDEENNQGYVVCCPVERKIAEKKCLEYKNLFGKLRTKREAKDSLDGKDSKRLLKFFQYTNGENMENLNWKETQKYKVVENYDDFSEYEDEQQRLQDKKTSSNCDPKANVHGILLLFNNCPLETESKEVVQTVIGGENAKPRQFPHMAALGFGKINSIKWGCGGSLISDHFILTAAHCTSGIHGRVKFVQLGDIKLDGTSSKLFFVRKIYVPKDYRPTVKYNDIALLQLNKPVKFSPEIFPACLEDVKDGFLKFDVQGLGWGKTENDAQSEILQVVNLEYFDNCFDVIKRNRFIPSGIKEESQICFGHKTEMKDTCGGDSGGPLNYFDGTYKVFGITSFGKDCAVVGYPAVYTRVSYFINWIEDIVWPN